MKIKSGFLSLCLMLIFSAGMNAQTKSVAEYFDIIPASYFGLGYQEIPVDARHAMIDELDVKNGWLRFSGKGEYVWEGSGVCVIFRKPDKSYMVAIAVSECGPLCMQFLHFLEYSNNVWTDVTEKVFQPVPKDMLVKKYLEVVADDEFASDPPVLYVLPRYGTAIYVVNQPEFANGKEKTLFTYTYANGVFTLNH
jgi:hypothetical protein